MGTEEGEQKGKEKEKRNDEPKVIFINKKSDKFKDNKYKDLTLKLSLTMLNSF